MSFTPQQIDSLKAGLDRKNVRQREQAGRKFSYVEGWHAIAEANRIFGFDAWDRETTELRLLGERQVGERNRVAYMARVRITVRTPDRVIVRDGCGYGSGIDKDIGQAHESALKEAETDAMKRALMTFGNPFGLALYDKDQANVVDAPEEPEPSSSQLMADAMVEALMKRTGPAAVEAFLAKDAIKRDLAVMELEDHTRVMRVAAERKAIAPAAHAERAA
ncbi:hypothetical protein LNAOJCKE_0905 [Methylorubrum aminovorans]|uniref:Rad52/22 double-strand break repair protein n=1 Tax=Methylorubrum aminovorans TaxID=269069 RepID=A0ABQ4U940_9HYPH|nr:RAD52 family DNA repair protein [Methylorubrum aminovorans]GJE63707.1 hypothetical protein LNAOJCKE_0905 [Methylorubrum aminovorans]GMA73638.1 hypothetical protein GCM10025880_00550 [Methylorubrum aminovorans]GMA79824.1 hypothetical protein GCM10025880_62410 [Methylorubrum aminovorans]